MIYTKWWFSFIKIPVNVHVSPITESGRHVGLNKPAFLSPSRSLCLVCCSTVCWPAGNVLGWDKFCYNIISFSPLTSIEIPWLHTWLWRAWIRPRGLVIRTRHLLLNPDKSRNIITIHTLFMPTYSSWSNQDNVQITNRYMQ